MTTASAQSVQSFLTTDAAPKTTMWTLGGGGFYVTVNTLKGKTKIHVRKYACDESGQIHPKTQSKIILNPVKCKTFFTKCQDIRHG